MKNKKVLSLALPMCRTYPHTAHALAILQNNPETYPWLLNSFIQIEGWDHENMDFEDFWIFECPLLICQRIGKDLLNYYEISMNNFLKDSIDRGYYIYLVVNTAKISEYGSANYPHDALIHGYDDERRVYFIADFYNGKRYGTKEIPYEEIYGSLELEDVAENHWIFRKDIILIRNNNEISGKFSPERVKHSINAYLNGVKTDNWYHRSQACYVRHPYELVYGINTYSIVYRHLKFAGNGVLQEHWRQVFHFFYEHKKVMTERLVYMSCHGYLNNGARFIDEYTNIKENAYFVRGQFLNLNNGVKVNIKEMENLISKIEKIERNLLVDIVNNIVPDDADEGRGLIFLPESYVI